MVTDQRVERVAVAVAVVVVVVVVPMLLLVLLYSGELAVATIQIPVREVLRDHN